MDIVVIGDDDDHQDIDDDSDFISTEHVSLTKELQQQQSKAVEELENILGEFELTSGETENYDRTDLLSLIHHLHRTVKDYKLRTHKPHHEKLEEEEEEDTERVNMIDVDSISDEKLKLEVKY